MVEEIKHKGEVLAIIISHQYQKKGIDFFTPGDFSQQLGYINYGAGHVIDPHVHNPVKREVTMTQEVLVLRKGKLRVDFYDDHQTYLESRELAAGDVILLAKGGHGFEVLEEVEMFEIKQGPYAGDADKTRFKGKAQP